MSYQEGAAPDADLPTKRALGRLDEVAEEWARDIGLDNMVSAIAIKDDRESRIAALVKQGYVEGCYRAYSEGAPAAIAIAWVEARAEFDLRAAGLLEANNREVARRRTAVEALRTLLAVVELSECRGASGGISDNTIRPPRPRLAQL